MCHKLVLFLRSTAQLAYAPYGQMDIGVLNTQLRHAFYASNNPLPQGEQAEDAKEEEEEGDKAEEGEEGDEPEVIAEVIDLGDDDDEEDPEVAREADAYYPDPDQEALDISSFITFHDPLAQDKKEDQ